MVVNEPPKFKVRFGMRRGKRRTGYLSEYGLTQMHGMFFRLQMMAIAVGDQELIDFTESLFIERDRE